MFDFQDEIIYNFAGKRPFTLHHQPKQGKVGVPIEEPLKETAWYYKSPGKGKGQGLTVAGQ